MSRLIDFHIHIDCYKEYQKIYDFFDKNRVFALFVTNLPEIYERCLSNFKKSEYVRFALGFNPQFAGEEKFNKQLFDKYFNSTKYIGEVGLDFSKDFISHKDLQIEAFDYICKKSGEYNKILSIHSRNAEEKALSILKINKVKFAVFHWYTGDLELIDEIVKAGYYFSVNSSMLRNDKGKKIISKMPIDRMLIETDGPFGKYNNKLISPENLEDVYNSFEKFLCTKELKKIVLDNLKTLLKKQIESC